MLIITDITSNESYATSGMLTDYGLSNLKNLLTVKKEIAKLDDFTFEPLNYSGYVKYKNDHSTEVAGYGGILTRYYRIIVTREFVYIVYSTAFTENAITVVGNAPCNVDATSIGVRSNPLLPTFQITGDFPRNAEKCGKYIIEEFNGTLPYDAKSGFMLNGRIVGLSEMPEGLVELRRICTTRKALRKTILNINDMSLTLPYVDASHVLKFDTIPRSVVNNLRNFTMNGNSFDAPSVFDILYQKGDDLLTSTDVSVDFLYPYGWSKADTATTVVLDMTNPNALCDYVDNGLCAYLICNNGSIAQAVNDLNAGLASLESSAEDAIKTACLSISTKLRDYLSIFLARSDDSTDVEITRDELQTLQPITEVERGNDMFLNSRNTIGGDLTFHDSDMELFESAPGLTSLKVRLPSSASIRKSVNLPSLSGSQTEVSANIGSYNKLFKADQEFKPGSEFSLIEKSSLTQLKHEYEAKFKDECRATVIKNLVRALRPLAIKRSTYENEPDIGVIDYRKRYRFKTLFKTRTGGTGYFPGDDASSTRLSELTSVKDINYNGGKSVYNALNNFAIESVKVVHDVDEQFNMIITIDMLGAVTGYKQINGDHLDAFYCQAIRNVMPSDCTVVALRCDGRYKYKPTNKVSYRDSDWWKHDHRNHAQGADNGHELQKAMRSRILKISVPFTFEFTTPEKFLFDPATIGAVKSSFANFMDAYKADYLATGCASLLSQFASVIDISEGMFGLKLDSCVMDRQLAGLMPLSAASLLTQAADVASDGRDISEQLSTVMTGEVMNKASSYNLEAANDTVQKIAECLASFKPVGYERTIHYYSYNSLTKVELTRADAVDYLGWRYFID